MRTFFRIAVFVLGLILVNMCDRRMLFGERGTLKGGLCRGVQTAEI